MGIYFTIKPTYFIILRDPYLSTYAEHLLFNRLLIVVLVDLFLHSGTNKNNSSQSYYLDKSLD